MTDELAQGLDTLIRRVDPKGSAVLEKNDRVARFTRGESPHELRIQYVPRNSWTLTYRVDLPGATARWFLESKWVWFPEKSGCKRLKLAALDEKYKVFASDEAFFCEVFADPKLVELLMRVPAESHVKENLRDGSLQALWRVRFEPGIAYDRDAVLLNAAGALIQHGLDCFSSVQRARLSRGEIRSFSP